MSARKSLSARFSKLLHKSSSTDPSSNGSSGNRLCNICKGIDFGNESADGKTVFSLGCLDDIERRATCPFCDFVLRSLRDGRIIQMQDVEHYRSREVRVFKSGPRKLSIQPLPSFSNVVYQTDVKGFERIASNEQVDFGMIKGWLQTCQTEHEKCQPYLPEFKIDFSFFRCIDVIDRRIVAIPISSQYAALSYKWGDVKPFLLEQWNKDDLFTEGGFEKHWNSVPRTIQDAIDLVRSLDCRYLWVDQVCLIQDDKVDMGKGIMAMDLVYEQSFFTIVAGSGVHAASGLPGVRPGSRTHSQQVSCHVLPGVDLVLRHTMEDLVSKSEYHHRGWTFQEYYLSRRKLIFIDDTVYFRCHETSCQELHDGLPVRRDPTTEQGQALHQPRGDVFHLLGQLLIKYSTRDLKMANDYINAMAGVCRRLADYVDCPLLYGVPVVALDCFILFYPHTSGLKRRDIFPSWSWSGWFGQIYYNYGSGNVANWISKNTWIIWYQRTESGELCPTLGVDDSKVSRARELFGSLCDTSQTEASSDIASEALKRPYALLQFWTASVHFALRRIDQDRGEQMMWSFGLYWTCTTCEVLDEDGANRGFVTLDDPQSSNNNYGSAELIILSASAENPTGAGKVSDPRGMAGGGAYLWVMVVEWVGGVAERKGIGKLHRGALASAQAPGLTWKEIILA
ncbi:HET-domain-containing protein [Xylariaceae sp. FL0016]|nr:HET-domain-containing protein [Xylariaceae sp. FL0016]